MSGNENRGTNSKRTGDSLFSSLLCHASMMHDTAAAHLRSKLCMAAVQSDTNHVLYVEYRREIADLEQVIYQFVDEHPEYGLNNYMDILQCYQIEWGVDSMSEADISHMDGRGIMALLVGAIRAERFSEGTLLNFFTKRLYSKMA